MMFLRYVILFLLTTSLANADPVPGTSTGITYNANSVMNPNTPTTNVNVNTLPSGIISVNDANITSTVQGMITQSPSMAGATIRVTCQQGIVTLDGAAKNMAQVTLAATIAQSITGVKGVNNRLTITSSGFQTGY